MEGSIRDGVQALRHHRPVHHGIPALDDGGGFVIGRGDDLESLVGQGVTQALTADDQHCGALGEVLVQEGRGVHGGREDLPGEGPDAVTTQFVDDGPGSTGGVVGHE